MPVARPALAGGRAAVSVTSLAKDRRFSQLTSNVQQRASNTQRPTSDAEWRTNDRRSIPPKLLSAEQSGFYLVGKLGGGDPGFIPPAGPIAGMGLKPEQLATMFGAVATPATALCLPAERLSHFSRFG